MRRINVYDEPMDEYDPNEPGREQPRRAGHFYPDRAERFDADTKLDRQANRVSVVTGSQWIDEYLYRTARGRWVLNRDKTRYYNGPDLYWFIDDEQARDWLLRSQINDDAVKRYFDELPEEEGPDVGGRPALDLDAKFLVQLRAGDTARVEAAAQAEGISRQEWLRRAVAAQLATEAPATS